MKRGRGLSALILAAGRSSRMENTHKLMLPLAGKTVLETVVAKALAAPFQDVIVVLGAARRELAQLLSNDVLTLVENDDFAAGMATSIVAGVARAPRNTAGYAMLLADMPLIETQTLISLCEDFAAGPIAQILAPTFQGKRGHPVMFSSEYRAELLGLKGDRGARTLLKKYAGQVRHRAVDDPGVLADMDTKEDYDALVQRLNFGKFP